MTPQAALTVLARQFGGRTAGLYRRPVGRRRGPLRRDLALAGHADPGRTTKETRNGTSLPPSNSGCSPQLIVFTRNAPPKPAPCPHRPRDPAPNPVPTTPDPASRSATPRRLNVADLPQPDLTRRRQTKPGCMAYRRSGPEGRQTLAKSASLRSVALCEARRISAGLSFRRGLRRSCAR
jgi:hypothetical protein